MGEDRSRGSRNVQFARSDVDSGIQADIRRELFVGAEQESFTISGQAALEAKEAADAVLVAVQKLPPLVSIGLAHAIDHLRALNTEAALQKCVSFRSFDDARSMHLSPNALQQLEVQSSAISKHYTLLNPAGFKGMSTPDNAALL